MKKLLGIILSITLVIGLLTGVSSKDVKAVTFIDNCIPISNTQVNLLSGYVYDLCANYEKGLVQQKYKRYENRYFPTPVEFSWDAVAGATNGYWVLIGNEPDLSDNKAYPTYENRIEIEDLCPGCDYYYQVLAEVGDETAFSGICHFTTTNLPRTIQVDKVYNTRDIGGCYVDSGQRVLFNKVIRGARLDDATDESRIKLNNTFGIKTDLDLRESSSVPEQSPLGESVNLINISSPQYTGDPSSSNKIGGIDRINSWPIIRQEMLVFANPDNYPIYVHCNIGRDRTGTLMFLLETILGMNENDMYRDYDLSFMAKIANDNIANTTDFNEYNIDAMVKYLNTYSGSTFKERTENFLKLKADLTDEDLFNIRKNLLSPSSETTTPAIPTEAPTGVTTQAPTDVSTAATTVAPTTVAPSTVAPSTVAPTTAAPTVAPTTVAPTTVAPTTVNPSSVVPTSGQSSTAAPTVEPVTADTTKVNPTSGQPSVVPTTVKPGDDSTAKPTGESKAVKPGKAKIKKIAKRKKSAKKIKVTLKKMSGVTGYQVGVFKKKKSKKPFAKKLTKKLKVTIKSKKLKGKKKVFVKARAYVMNGSEKIFGAWSKAKKSKAK